MKHMEEQLTGGHPNSLGNTIEVVEEESRIEGLDEASFGTTFPRYQKVRSQESSKDTDLDEQVR